MKTGIKAVKNNINMEDNFLKVLKLVNCLYCQLCSIDDKASFDVFTLGRHCCTCIFYNKPFLWALPYACSAVRGRTMPYCHFLASCLSEKSILLAFFWPVNLNHFKIRTILGNWEKLCCVCIPLVCHSTWTNKYVHFGLKGTVAQLKSLSLRCVISIWFNIHIYWSKMS